MALFPFKVQVANHEQGRVNLPASYNQRTQLEMNQDSCQAVVFKINSQPAREENDLPGH
jgi:hypothetical protein